MATNLLKSLSNDVIVCFEGTFDPPHVGHLSALDAAVNQAKLDHPGKSIFSIVIPDDEPNNYKPDRQSIEHRRQMCQLLFDCPDVHVASSNESKSSIRESLTNHRKLNQDAPIIRLIGSDVVSYMIKKSKIDSFFSMVYVSIRNEQPLAAQFNSIESKIVKPSIVDASSTKIRHSLFLHDEYYRSFENVDSTVAISLGLTEPVLRYIFKHKLYYNFHKLKQSVTDVLQRCGLPKIKNLSVSSVSPSGNVCFIGDEQFFVKVFTVKGHRQMCENEAKGIELFDQLNLCSCKSLDPLLVRPKHFDSFSLIVTKYLSSNEYFCLTDPFEKNDAERFIDGCRRVGKALSELHHINLHKIALTGSAVNGFVVEHEIVRRIVKLEAILYKVDPKYRNAINDAAAEFNSDPGFCSHVHGDANLSNFMIPHSSLKDKRIVVLDLDRFYQSNGFIVDEKKRGYGFPAEDYYRFLACINWMNSTKYKQSDAFVANAKKAFIDGYGSIDFFKGSQNFYQMYWMIRDLLI